MSLAAALATACVPDPKCVQSSAQPCSPDAEITNVSGSLTDCGTWAEYNGQVIDPNRAAETCALTHYQGTDDFIVRYENRGDGTANGTAILRPVAGQPALLAIIYQKSTAHNEATQRSCLDSNIVVSNGSQIIHCANYGDPNILCNYVAGCQ
jgi:hypothetical protein